MPKLKIIQHDLGIDTEAAYIIPLSDMHIGAGFESRKFNGYRQWILDRPNAYCVVVGDVIDNAISDSIGDTYGTMRPSEQIELAEETLRPLAEAGKILAWVEGNHEIRTARKTDQFVGKDLCKLFGIKDYYDPDGLYMFVSVGYDRAKGQRNRNVYTGFMIHGFTGGKRMGGKANALEDMARSVQADFYIAAHSHTKITFPSYALIPETRSKTLRFKKRTHVMAGSFQSWEGYAVRQNYQPTPMGSPRLRLDGLRLDLHVSI